MLFSSMSNQSMCCQDNGCGVASHRRAATHVATVGQEGDATLHAKSGASTTEKASCCVFLGPPGPWPWLAAAGHFRRGSTLRHPSSGSTTAKARRRSVKRSRSIRTVRFIQQVAYLYWIFRVCHILNVLFAVTQRSVRWQKVFATSTSHEPTLLGLARHGPSLHERPRTSSSTSTNLYVLKCAWC